MIQLLDIDLADQKAVVPPLRGEAWVLVRHGDRVLGEVVLHDVDPLEEPVLRARLADEFAGPLYGLSALSVRSAQGPATGGPATGGPATGGPATGGEGTGGLAPSSVSVVVCTRDRPKLLDGCLRSLGLLDPAPGEVLVVDNASSDDATRQTARRHGVRVVVEPEPGLDRARNRGWQEATGQVVAYVDDDARADRAFAAVVGRAFASPGIAAVTGLVLPAEVETPAQLRFERREGGMRKGFDRRLFHRASAPVGLHAFNLGVGTNMAFRRGVLDELGGFDPRLDVGTPTRGGGDLDMLWRVVEAGHTVLYEPSALVRHLHRRTAKGLVAQMRDNGVAYRAFLAKCEQESPGWAGEVRRELRRWHRDRHLRRMLGSLRRRDLLGFRMAAAELAGSRRGVEALAQASR